MIEIIHADMMDAVRALQPASIDCILTDPPYGETSLEWDHWPTGWPAKMLRLLKPTGSMWVFGSLRMFFGHLPEFSGWSMSQEVIWEKQNGTGFAADRFRRVHEMAVHFYPSSARWGDIYKLPQMTMDAVARTITRRPGPTHTGQTRESTYRSQAGGGRLMRSVIYARSEHGCALHPTQKPAELVAPLLRYACPVGGLVLDPFAGSGTTGVVARECGMSATLIEKNAAFVEVIKRRLEDDVPLFRRAGE